MNHCHFCGNNIPDDTDTCTQAGYACDGPKLPENMNQSQPEKAERGIEEIMRECDVLFDGIELAKSWFRKQITGIHQSHHQELQKARTAEQERVVGMLKVLKKDENVPCLIAHCSCKAEARAHNRVIECITEAIRNKELTD